jgi:hypothetical protein
MLEVNSSVGIMSWTREQKYILLEFYRFDHECILKLSLKLLTISNACKLVLNQP